MRKVKNAVREGRFAEAEQLLTPVVLPEDIGRLPAATRGEVLTLWGDVLLARDDPEGALEAFDEARHSGAAAEVRAALTMRLVECCLAVSDSERARQLLESLDSHERERPAAQLLEALVLYTADEKGRAGRLFGALLERGPVREAAHYLGVLAYERGEHEAALRHFADAIRMDANDYYSRVYHARCLLDLDRAAEAEAALLELRAGRSAPEVDCLLGRSLLRQRRDEQALERFRAASTRQPDYAEALFGEASALRRLGHHAEARQTIERFRRLHNHRERQRQRLEALHQRSLRERQNWQVYREMARISRSVGDLEAAERHAWSAVRLAPLEDSCRLLLARVFTDQGRYQAAARQYQKVLRRDGNHRQARAELEQLIREHTRREP